MLGGHVASGNHSHTNYWQKPVKKESGSVIFPLGKIMEGYLRKPTSCPPMGLGG